MFIELQVKVGTTERRVFLRAERTEFFNHMSSIHCHSFTEIHVVAAGAVSFEHGGKQYTLSAGHLLAIPANEYHTCTNTDRDNLYANFFIDIPLNKAVMRRIDPTLTTAFLQEYVACQRDGNYARMAAFIALLACHIFAKEKVTADRMTDHSLAISDYFNRHFADASLGELAKELYLSEKQTERLVYKYTGHTFKQNVVYHRIRAATVLLQAGHMSKKAIAEYVGYATYGGFYKALREYGEAVETYTKGPIV